MAKVFQIVATPGLTATLTITRKSDGYYWTGSAWQSGSATVAMTEVENYSANYSEYYSTTEPDTACFWKALDSSNNLLDRGEYDPSAGSQATASSIAPTTADLKEFLNIKTADSGDDTFLGNCANRAGAFIEDWCQRRFATSSRTYVLSGNGTNKMYLPDWPITAVTSIYGPCVHYPRHFTSTGGSVDSTELVDSDKYIIGNLGQRDEMKNHILNIASGSVYGFAAGIWDYGYQNFEVVATTGYSSLPSDLYAASLYVAAIYYKLGKDGLLGLTSKTVDGGALNYEVERGLPFHVFDILKKYRRWTA